MSIPTHLRDRAKELQRQRVGPEEDARALAAWEYMAGRLIPPNLRKESVALYNERFNYERIQELAKWVLGKKS